MNGTMSNFNTMDLTNEFKTKGQGLNFKLGVIYRPVDFLRIGGAIHSPTLLSMRDRFSSSMETSLDTSGFFQWDSPRGEFEYQLVTPWRATMSAAFVFKKFGFISVDYEYVDYGNAAFDFDKNFDFDDGVVEQEINETIDFKYTRASNLRIGGEIKFGAFRARAGYAYYGSPFKSNIAASSEFDNTRQSITGGLGFKADHVFVDVAYIHTLAKEYDLQYTLSDASVINEGAEITKNSGNLVMSVGFRF